ncbi:MAG: hypothetical protein COV74_07550 [Candidatus Omnitrophica bacterium CG11_big_fil_rev_8_21_14_0_20_45_26]|uniref:JAB domain-containing protein n=1 Tax=Candidatus Abzuiibacterium crystallinum TaxID=1974748 RepID=A0A2H0LPY5_9BACT|nr:MAG: hypothetical protein COV74_07550 [Candidatus Omnitrophica bacterium CG11_big_fil_rev_8_21_14_0_20_45_26]PIW64139.1 MAG: hypothetical protein COW12_07430 [Candidatus Omnitrophica bacterium CG12_big_fil_rev_8_21_14_0_65_45_16]
MYEVRIPKRIIDAIYRHAVAEFPHECCGVIVGPKIGVGTQSKGSDPNFDLEMALPCRNLQNEMHSKDPRHFPRTSEEAYFLDPKDMLNIQKICREKSHALKVIYHSHVNVGAYFSAEDKKQALFEGNPIYPNVNFMVVDVTNQQALGAKFFTWNAAQKDFVEVPWTMG